MEHQCASCIHYKKNEKKGICECELKLSAYILSTDDYLCGKYSSITEDDFYVVKV